MSEPGILLNAKNPVYEDRMTREENPHSSVICESEMPGVVWQSTVSSALPLFCGGLGRQVPGQEGPLTSRRGFSCSFLMTVLWIVK